MIVPDNGGMFFCGLAEHMINGAMLEAIEESDPKLAVDRLFKDLTEVSSWIKLFCYDFCLIICGRFNPGHQEIKIKSEVAVDELVFPYFVSKPRE